MKGQNISFNKARDIFKNNKKIVINKNEFSALTEKHKS